MDSAILKGAMTSVEGNRLLKTSRWEMDSPFPSSPRKPEGGVSTLTTHTGRLPGTQESGGRERRSGRANRSLWHRACWPARRIRVVAVPLPSHPGDKWLHTASFAVTLLGGDSWLWERLMRARA